MGGAVPALTPEEVGLGSGHSGDWVASCGNCCSSPDPRGRAWGVDIHNLSCDLFCVKADVVGYGQLSVILLTFHSHDMPLCISALFEER